MRAGLLRHRVKVIKVTYPTPDTYGERAPFESTDRTVWARIEPLKSQELFEAQQVQSEVTHRITLRWNDADIKQVDQIDFVGRRFEVDSVRNIDERRRTYEIMAIERDT